MYDSIPICRSIFKHWIYTDPEYLKIWLTMLGRARYTKEPKKIMFEGALATVNYGEFVFGYNAWSKATDVSIKRIRTLVNVLIDDGMIEKVKSTNRFTIYRVVNYEKFNNNDDAKTGSQESNNDEKNANKMGSQEGSQEPAETQGLEDKFGSQEGSQGAVKGQSRGKLGATNEEGIRKHKKVKEVYGEFENVFLASDEVEKVKAKFGDSNFNAIVEKLGSYILSKGDKYKSHYGAINSWVGNSVLEEKQKQPNKPKRIGDDLDVL